MCSTNCKFSLNALFVGKFLLVALLFKACNDPMPKTMVYPAPDNLSQVEGLSQSPFFTINIEEQSAFVYYGRDDAPDEAYQGKGISFLNFEMSYGPVMVDVKTSEAMDSFTLIPFNGNVTKLDSNLLQVQFDEPDKLLLTVFLQEHGKQQLVISAEMPDWKKPKEGDRGVLYLKPGVYKKGENWNPFTEDIHTLYLEGGSVLQATITVKGGREVKIMGRGIISQAFAKRNKISEPWYANSHGISITDSKKVKIEGITVLNSPGCQLAINNADEVLMKNVKLCGFGSQQNDGLHLFSRNVIAEDMFIISSVDRITLNGFYDSQAAENVVTSCIAENIQIRDVKVYGVKHGSDIMLTKNANKDLRTVLIENVTSLAPTSGGFIAAKHSGNGGIFDIVVIDSKVMHQNLLDVEVEEGEGAGKIRSLFLDNIQVDAKPSQIGATIKGYSEERNITDVILTNISAKGNFVKEFDQMGITTNEYVSDLKVRFEIRDEY